MRSRNRGDRGSGVVMKSGMGIVPWRIGISMPRDSKAWELMLVKVACARLDGKSVGATTSQPAPGG
jgi:hypothetical protein